MVRLFLKKRFTRRTVSNDVMEFYQELFTDLKLFGGTKVMQSYLTYAGDDNLY